MNLEKWKEKIKADGGSAHCIAKSGEITVWKAYGKTDDADEQKIRFYKVWNGDACAYFSVRRSEAKAVFDLLTWGEK